VLADKQPKFVDQDKSYNIKPKSKYTNKWINEHSFCGKIKDVAAENLNRN
jgi:hypothetical protein